MAKRDYNNDFPSVTQVLDTLRKPGLENWFKYNTIQFIKKESEEGKLIGTQIHEAIQQHIEKDVVSVETAYADQVKHALEGFMAFKKANPTIYLQKAEIALTSVKYEYNGTLDCIGKVGDNLVLFDWKSGKTKDKDKPDIYAEYRYQVAAYVKAFNETQKDKVIMAYILVLAKDKVAYNFEEMKMAAIDEMFEEVFLPALKICKFQRRAK